jgi:hypothetical protein
MNRRSDGALVPRLILGGLLIVGLAGVPGCELLVNLDRSVIEAGAPDGCSICTELTDGGGDGEVDGAPKDGTAPETGSTDAARDATRGDGGTGVAATDAATGG